MMHPITRRDFLKVAALGAGAVVLSGCKFPQRFVVLEPYVSPPEEQLSGQATWYASICRMCPAGCGIVVRTMNGRAVKIEGNPEHPLNQGKLCARGQAGLQLLYHPDRLRSAVLQSKRGSRGFTAISWNEAINTLTSKLQAAGSSIAVYGSTTMSGHLYSLFKLFCGAVGAPAPVLFDLHSELSGLSVLKDVSQTLFGSAALPLYDLGSADLVLSFGADFLGSSDSQVYYGSQYGHFRRQDLAKRGYLVQLESKMSITGAMADLWLPIRPGSEGLLAQAIAYLIASKSIGLPDRIERARSLVKDVDINTIASLSDLPVEKIEHLARLFGTLEHPVAIPAGNLAGLPEAFEVLSAVQMLNVIAGLNNVALTPAAPSPLLEMLQPSAFSEVQSLVADMNSGKVQVLVIAGANPAYELPPKTGFSEALDKVPFVVSFSPLVDETSVFADLIIPDRTYLEGWGYQVVNPSPGISIVGSQQPVVTPLYGSLAAGDVWLTVAKALPAAVQNLPWIDEVAYIKEMITQLPPGSLGGSGAEVLWERFQQHGGWWSSSIPAPVALNQSVFQSPAPALPATQYQGNQAEYPFHLHLFMSDLLGDGNAASLPWLQGSPDPMTTVCWQTWVEINPDTALEIGVKDGDIVKITSPHGEIEAIVYTYPAIRPDTVAIPTGQGHSDLGRYARERGANPMQLVGVPVDPGSRLNWTNLRVKITRTGKRAHQALFEFKPGVQENFINQGVPGL